MSMVRDRGRVTEPKRAWWRDRQSLPSRIELREVCIREGFQRGPYVPLPVRVAVATKLLKAGVKRLQVASMVNASLVPQMAEAENLLAMLRCDDDVIVDVVCLNQRGIERALRLRDQGVSCLRQIDIPGAATDTVLRNNGIPHDVDTYFRDVLPKWVATARQDDVRVLSGISAAFGCSVEGYVAPERVVELAERARDAGVDGVYIGDSTGEGAPNQVADVFERLLDAVPELTLHAHFHNNRGAGIANCLAILELGEAVASRVVFDTSIGEHGGCPFLDAAGNLSTEDLLCMTTSMGIESGLHYEGILSAARTMAEQYGDWPFMSHTLRYGPPTWWDVRPVAGS